MQIREAVQTPNAIGGYDRTYNTLTTVWGDIRPTREYAAFVRGVQIGEYETHEITMRLSAVEHLNAEFDSAFGDGTASLPDVNPIKSTFFIFVEKASSTHGRLFKVKRVKMDETFKEYIKLFVEEVEEHGTGYTETATGFTDAD
jgi:hypothetical protein